MDIIDALAIRKLIGMCSLHKQLLYLVDTNPHGLWAFAAASLLSKHLKNLKDVHLIVSKVFIEHAFFLFFENLSGAGGICNHLFVNFFLSVSVANLLRIEPVLDEALRIHTVVLVEYLALAQIAHVARSTHIAHAPNKVVTSLLEGRLLISFLLGVLRVQI